MQRCACRRVGACLAGEADMVAFYNEGSKGERLCHGPVHEALWRADHLSACSVHLFDLAVRREAVWQCRDGLPDLREHLCGNTCMGKPQNAQLAASLSGGGAWTLTPQPDSRQDTSELTRAHITTRYRSAKVTEGTQVQPLGNCSGQLNSLLGLVRHPQISGPSGGLMDPELALPLHL